MLLLLRVAAVVFSLAGMERVLTRMATRMMMILARMMTLLLLLLLLSRLFLPLALLLPATKMETPATAGCTSHPSPPPQLHPRLLLLLMLRLLQPTLQARLHILQDQWLSLESRWSTGSCPRAVGIGSTGTMVGRCMGGETVAVGTGRCLLGMVAIMACSDGCLRVVWAAAGCIIC